MFTLLTNFINNRAFFQSKSLGSASLNLEQSPVYTFNIYLLFIKWYLYNK